MRIILTSAAACSLLLGVLAATNAGGQPPEQKTGLKIGAKAPVFTLKDQSSKERSLDEFLNKGKVALVFYRSASW